jgi:hypothetical protein
MVSGRDTFCQPFRTGNRQEPTHLNRPRGGDQSIADPASKLEGLQLQSTPPCKIETRVGRSDKERMDKTPSISSSSMGKSS